jgi:sortase (surface protein transpeptidase)
VQTGAYDGVYGREITVPSDYAQVLPVPHVNSTAVPADAERLITLTTCHPQFSDAERMIIHGVLVKSYAKSPGFLPPELGEG